MSLGATRTLRASASRWRLSRLAPQARNLSLARGDTVHDYTVDRIVDVPKLDLKAYELVHAQSGSRHLHVARPDTNKVFAVGFRTLPPDHSGLPHILEHTTLCGSQKFPVRDPFFKMLTRSLANYMNALTGIDYTFYPFATTNDKDFANLQQVYLDSVFNPLLRQADFRQEGWRLEHQDPEDQSSPLSIKGVVYNEMKGQLSNPAYLFYIRFFHTIYPSLQFSGGDPKFMTNLSYEDLVNFHAEKYNPSNSFSFSYGNMDPAEVLGPLAQSIAKFPSSQRAPVSLPEPISLTETREVELEGPLDPTIDPEKQYKVSLSWIVADASDLKTSIEWKVLGTLLTDGHSSPFYKALIDSGIGTDFSVNTGLEETPAKIIFTVGLQGLSKDSVPAFKAAVADVLKDIATNGIPRERLDAILNQAELADREVDASLGMDLVSRVFPRVFIDSNYTSLLDNEKLLDSFKRDFAEHPSLFQDLVRDHLVSSPYLQFAMTPSADYEASLEAAEASRLNELVSNLSSDDKTRIYEGGLELLKSQQTKEDVSVLPTLAAEDISPEASKHDVKKSTLPNSKASLFTREVGTQGITYAHILKNISGISSDLYPYLSLFGTATTNVGSNEHSMGDLEHLIRLHTGGISTSLMVKSSLEDRATQMLLNLGGSALDEKSAHIYDLLYEVLVKAKFDNIEKLKALVQGSAANALNSLSDSGHRFAMSHARAAITGKCNLEEQLAGMPQIQHIMELSKMDDDALLKNVVPKLYEIQQYVTKRAPETGSDIRGGLTYTPGSGPTNEKLLDDFLTRLPVADEARALNIPGLTPGNSYQTLFQLPFQVSYVGAAVPGAGYFDKDSAALQILANLLTHRHLHTEIREKGGAYGGGASYSAVDGVFGFYSYRDPSPVNTIATIRNAGEWAAKNEWTERDLHESKLSIFQGIDGPISPRAEISYELLHGLTNEARQARREMLREVSIADVKHVAEKYLAPIKNAGKADSGASVAVLGPARPEFVAGEGWAVENPEGSA